MERPTVLVIFVSMALLVACDKAPGPPAAAHHVVDSLLPREEALARFRAPLTPTDSLAGGASSASALVGDYLRALSAGDSSAFTRLAVDKAEFAYLYYPTAPQAQPPYNLDPDLMWFMLFERSNQGVLRALRRYGGQHLELLDLDCGAGRSREGANTVFGPCTVRWRDSAGQVAGARLFSQIVERGGRYKFLSYANKL